MHNPNDLPRVFCDYTLKFQNGIEIEYDTFDDGGGSEQYVDFLEYLQSTGKKYKHCLEWCSGLGAIGYSLLDAGICETITFVDKYEPAIHKALKNAEKNNVKDKVQAYQSDAISKLPKHLKFDLIVANPPHQLNAVYSNEYLQRIMVDKNWEIHKEFFANISSYLQPNCDIILSETAIMDEHIEFATEAGLIYKKDVRTKILLPANGRLMIYQNYND